MGIIRLLLCVLTLTIVLGCGATPEVEDLPPPERFDWGGGQPIRFTPAPPDWRREKTTSGGLLGLRFVKTGSVGEGITMAEAFHYSDHDRCAEIDELLARCNEVSWRDLSKKVQKSRINVWNPVSDLEEDLGDHVNQSMDRAVEAARNGDSFGVCRELETAREQASRIVFSIEDVPEEDLVVFRTGRLVPAKSFTLLGTTRTKVAGQPAVRRDYTFDSRHTFIGRELFFMVNNRLFVAHFHGLAENVPLFEGMIDSIIFPAGECEH